MGLYGNDLAEAWYGGYVGDGSKLSQIHFFKDLPPAKFFWSVTLWLPAPDGPIYLVMRLYWPRKRSLRFSRLVKAFGNRLA
jgi:hypothetical protein